MTGDERHDRDQRDVAEYARAEARADREKHGPASDETAAVVNRVLREQAEAS